MAHPAREPRAPLQRPTTPTRTAMPCAAPTPFAILDREGSSRFATIAHLEGRSHRRVVRARAGSRAFARAVVGATFGATFVQLERVVIVAVRLVFDLDLAARVLLRHRDRLHAFEALAARDRFFRAELAAFVERVARVVETIELLERG